MALKILLLTDNFTPEKLGSGSGAVVYSLAKKLLKNNHKIFIISTVQNKSEEGESNFKGIKIFRIYSNYHPRWQGWRSLYNFQIIPRVKKIIKEIKPDVVHAHILHYYLSYHCLRIARKYAKSVFLTIHDVMPIHYGKLMPKNENYKISIWTQIGEAKKRYNPFRNIIIRHYLRYVDKIFAVSNSLKKVLEIHNIKGTEVIYNGIDVNDWETDTEKIRKFKQEHNLQNRRAIFFCGRLSGAKGGDQILKAVALIKDKIKNITLLIAGQKNQYVEEMEELVKELGIEKNVIFTEWLKPDELKTAYHSIDISVLPSLCFETFGMTNLEAMACKKPVISSYFGGPEEVVVDPAKGGASAQTGYLINPYDIELMAEKILDLLNNPKKAKRFGQAGYQRAKKEFSVEKQVEKTMKWYKKYLK